MAADGMNDDDAMAAEWAAALAESKPEPVGGLSGEVRVSCAVSSSSILARPRYR